MQKNSRLRNRGLPLSEASGRGPGVGLRKSAPRIYNAFGTSASYKMNPNPLISIVIPTFNRRHFVGDAIDSCLAQTYPHREIIVVDDGSADGSASALRAQYADRIRLIVQQNQGPAIARNRGIAAAKGDFIHFLDADDMLAPDKLRLCLDRFIQQPDIAVIYTHHQLVSADGRKHLPTPPFRQFCADAFCQLLRNSGDHILLSTTLIRRSALRSVGGFEDSSDFRSAEDWDLFLRLAQKHKFHAINQPLVFRRVHADMLSDDRLQTALGRLRALENARDYGWRRCMDAAEFQQRLAARHHVLALAWWRHGERAKARDSFAKACQIYPPDSMPRRLFSLYTWLLPPASVGWTLALRRLFKRDSATAEL